MHSVPLVIVRAENPESFIELCIPDHISALKTNLYSNLLILTLCLFVQTYLGCCLEPSSLYSKLIQRNFIMSTFTLSPLHEYSFDLRP